MFGKYIHQIQPILRYERDSAAERIIIYYLVRNQRMLLENRLEYVQQNCSK